MEKVLKPVFANLVLHLRLRLFDFVNGAEALSEGSSSSRTAQLV
jgi:hypothetical protein